MNYPSDSEVHAFCAQNLTPYNGPIRWGAGLQRFNPVAHPSGEPYKGSSRPGWIDAKIDGAIVLGNHLIDSSGSVIATWQPRGNRRRSHTEMRQCNMSRQQAKDRSRKNAETFDEHARLIAQYLRSSMRGELDGEWASPDCDHPYIVSKGCKAYDVFRTVDWKGRDTLEYPRQTLNGDIVNIEIIRLNGDVYEKRPKMLLHSDGEYRTGRVKDCFHLIGEYNAGDEPSILNICEGVATGASIHEATGEPVMSCGSSHNAAAICMKVVEKHPSSTVYYHLDNDAAGLAHKERLEQIGVFCIGDFDA